MAPELSPNDIPQIEMLGLRAARIFSLEREDQGFGDALIKTRDGVVRVPAGDANALPQSPRHGDTLLCSHDGERWRFAVVPMSFFGVGHVS